MYLPPSRRLLSSLLNRTLDLMQFDAQNAPPQKDGARPHTHTCSLPVEQKSKDGKGCCLHVTLRLTPTLDPIICTPSGRPAAGLVSSGRRGVLAQTLAPALLLHGVPSPDQDRGRGDHRRRRRTRMSRQAAGEADMGRDQPGRGSRCATRARRGDAVASGPGPSRRALVAGCPEQSQGSDSCPHAGWARAWP